VVRSGLVEGRHHGHALVLDPDGGLLRSWGDPTAPMYPRSANKPLQAVAMLRCGLADVVGGDERLIAIAAASHSGEQRHIGAVNALLERAGLSADALDNTPGLPLDEQSAWSWLRSGGGPDGIHQNCSGKHAAMLATCVTAGWPTDGYRDPQHPLQQSIRRTIEELTGEPVPWVGVDGCGAPLFATSLAGLARAYRALALAEVGTAEARVAAAMEAHPEMVGGTGRSVTVLMSAVPGCIAKDGAEGVFAAATATGAAVAVKVDDGAARAAVPVAVACLRLVGVDAPDELATTPVLGHGEPVGEVRPALGD
jgi:L-asparaginase II